MTGNTGRRELLVALGGAAAWPLAARAQQGGKIPTVGYLWHAGSPQEEVPYFGALLEGFAKLGYVDGRNIKLEHRFRVEPFLLTHEIVEKALHYLHAHQVAVRAERDAVKAAGVSWWSSAFHEKARAGN